jgi:capsule polysaccharide export protein KpsE/RkpR
LEADLGAKKEDVGKLFDLAKQAGFEDAELMDLGKLGTSLKERQRRGEQGLQTKIERVMMLSSKIRELGNSEAKVGTLREETGKDDESIRDMKEGIEAMKKEIAAAHERLEGKGGEKGLKARLEENKEKFMMLTGEISEKIKEIEELKKVAGLAEPGETARQ